MVVRDAHARTIGGLLALAGAQLAVGIGVIALFVYTSDGQRAETAALQGNTFGRERISALADTVLDLVSVLSVAAAIVVVAFIALVRRRMALALAASVLIIGASLTARILKNEVIDRPELGADAFPGMTNSLPSGHATVAASVAAALVLVLPPRARGIAAVAGAGYAALTGIATLAAGWHRPSDVIVAYLVAGAWAAIVSLVVVGRRPADEHGGGGDAHPVLATLLAFAGLALLALGFLALWASYGLAPEQYTPRRLFAAYAGGAAGIAGTACVVFAVLVAVVHRVVPVRAAPPSGSSGHVPMPRPPAASDHPAGSTSPGR